MGTQAPAQTYSSLPAKWEAQAKQTYFLKAQQLIHKWGQIPFEFAFEGIPRFSRLMWGSENTAKIENRVNCKRGGRFF